METKYPTKKHFTFNELLKRWQCSENELKTAIIRAELKPSIKLNDRLRMLTWHLDIEGKVSPSECDSHIERNSQQWLYLQDPIQTAPFDCVFIFAADDRDAIKNEAPLSTWVRLSIPITIDGVKNKTVFFISEVEKYEAAYISKTSVELYEKSLGKRERDTLLKIVLGMAVKGYGFDPNAAKSPTPIDISKDLSQLGLDVTDETVRKYLKEAANLFLPSKPR